MTKPLSRRRYTTVSTKTVNVDDLENNNGHQKNKSTKLAYHHNATAGGPSHGHRQYAAKIMYLYFTKNGSSSIKYSKKQPF